MRMVYNKKDKKLRVNIGSIFKNVAELYTKRKDSNTFVGNENIAKEFFLRNIYINIYNHSKNETHGNFNAQVNSVNINNLRIDAMEIKDLSEYDDEHNDPIENAGNYIKYKNIIYDIEYLEKNNYENNVYILSCKEKGKYA